MYEREWAEPLSDTEFTHEFGRRYPVADSIPIRSEYIKFGKLLEGVEEQGIDAIHDDKVDIVKPPLLIKKLEVRK